MKLTLALAILASLCTPVLAADVLPTMSMTPGVIATSSWNDICKTHLSRNRDVNEAEKRDVFVEYSVTNNTGYCSRLATSGTKKGKVAGCEIDHDLPLENGGSNDIKNLWPQPYAGTWNAHMKDKMENRLHSIICEKQLTDDQVKSIQTEFLTDWTKMYTKYYGAPKQ